MDRTIKVHLHPTPEQAAILCETVAQFTHAYNAVCEYGWNTSEKNGVRLHHATYYQTKASCPGLVSDLLIQARVKATETLKSAFTWKAKHTATHAKRVEKAKKQRKLQSNGSKSAKRHLKKVGQRQARFHRDCDHVLSKQIVASTPAGATIVLENLTNIRDTSRIGRGKQKPQRGHSKNVENKRKLHAWTFAQLFGFIAYKGQERGIRVEKVDPRHTSQTCSRCRHQARTNRRSQCRFLCRKCKYSLNADLNAAYNIRDKYIRASLALFSTPLESGSPCQAASGLDSSSEEPRTSPHL